jgi:serine/threonine protein phosphatase 1
MRWLRAIFHRQPAAAAPLPRPEAPVCVIGDVHGRLDLLEGLLAKIALQPDHDLARLVFVGDLMDRGPDSAGVLARVHAACPPGPGAKATPRCTTWQRPCARP